MGCIGAAELRVLPVLHCTTWAVSLGLALQRGACQAVAACIVVHGGLHLDCLVALVTTGTTVPSSSSLERLPVSSLVLAYTLGGVAL
jgi:hypothetical protein